MVNRGVKVNVDDDDDKNEQEQKVNDKDDDDKQWKRVQDVIICISELYSKYNKSEENDIYHDQICNLLMNCGNLANKSFELCALIQNENDNFENYKALNILSALCQSNAQLAYTYLTYKYFAKNGYDNISDIPSSDEDGWKINIFFNKDKV